MDTKGVTRFLVETSNTQVARRPQRARDGAYEVYVTRRHYKALMYIAQMIERDYHPSFKELQEHCGYRSPDAAWKAVRALAKLGLMTTDIRRARSIQLTEQGRMVYAAWKAAKEKRRAKA